MRNFPVQKNKIFISVLTLICASLACNIPDVGSAVVVPEDRVIDKIIEDTFHDDCASVDRDEYEMAVAFLEREPEMPKNPEGATYFTCYESDGLYDAFMVDGPEPEKNEEMGNNQVNPIPAGTYVGETTFSSNLEDDWDYVNLGPVCTDNTATVVVESDGSVHGEIRSICYTQQDTDNEEMQQTHHSEVTGVIQGELLDTTGQLSIAYTWHSYFTSPQWETPGLDTTNNFDFAYHVEVSGNVMTLTPMGDVEAYYSFELIKE